MDTSNQNNTSSPVNNPLAVMQNDERIICNIKRHPFGILSTYLIGGLLLIALAVITFIITPNVFGDGSAIMALGGLAFTIFTLLSVGFLLIATMVYSGNHWEVTTDSITEFAQFSLFNKQTAQLSLGNLEDMTVDRIGIPARIFNFGTLTAETAGEHSKFVFPYCPNPHLYAQKILAAREDFELGHHGGKQPPRPDALNRPQELQQPQAQPATVQHEKAQPSAVSVEQLGQAALSDFANSEQPQQQDTNYPSQYPPAR